MIFQKREVREKKLGLINVGDNEIRAPIITKIGGNNKGITPL